MIELPIWGGGRKGPREIVGVALLDDEDFARLSHLPWRLDLSGYAVRLGPRVGGRQIGYRLHREVAGLAPGDKRQVDHINGVRLDCRRMNLRVVTAAENMQNVRSRGGTSRHRGVSRHPGGLWLAQVGSGRTQTRRYCATEAEAITWAREERLRRFPLTNEERSCA